ncbi:MAG: hypothetical protein R6W69_12100 [Anaerolineales bacterium]
MLESNKQLDIMTRQLFEGSLTFAPKCGGLSREFSKSLLLQRKVPEINPEKWLCVGAHAPTHNHFSVISESECAAAMQPCAVILFTEKKK